MLGLSRSRLNERYHSVERLVSERQALVNGQEINNHDLDNMESVSQRGVPKSLSGSRTWNKYDLLEERCVVLCLAVWYIFLRFLFSVFLLFFHLFVFLHF